MIKLTVQNYLPVSWFDFGVINGVEVVGRHTVLQTF